MTASASIISLIIVCIIYILYYSIAQLKKYASFNKLPGPSSFELLKMTFRNESAYDKYHNFVNLTECYGPVLKLWVKPFTPIVVVADVEIMNKILSSKYHIARTKTYNMMRSFLGDGIGTTSKAEIWKPVRKACNTVFQPAKVIEYLPLIRKHTNRFFEIVQNHLENVVDLQPLLHVYGLDVVFELVTKRDQNFQNNKDFEYVNAIRMFFQVMAERIYSAFLQNDILFKLSKYFKPWDRAARIVDQRTDDIIKSEEIVRKDAIREGPTQHVIDVLLANDFGTRSKLNEHIKTFILAGHDTVGKITAFILYDLSKHPKIQQKVFEEVTSVVGQGGEVTNDDLKQMTYLEAVVHETMRLHCVVPFIERKSGSSVEIDGIHYPEGTRFIFSIVGFHKSSRYFENPDEFNPDRLLPENDHLQIKQSLMSFSMGPRNCIGKLFGMLVLKYFTARIIQQFELFPDTNHILKTLGEFVLTSKTDIPVILKKRRS